MNDEQERVNACSRQRDEGVHTQRWEPRGTLGLLSRVPVVVPMPPEVRVLSMARQRSDHAGLWKVRGRLGALCAVGVREKT